MHHSYILIRHKRSEEKLYLHCAFEEKLVPENVKERLNTQHSKKNQTFAEGVLLKNTWNCVVKRQKV